MKKILSFTLALILCFPLCACMSKEESKFVGEYKKSFCQWDEAETLSIKSDGTYFVETTRDMMLNDREYEDKPACTDEDASYEEEEEENEVPDINSEGGTYSVREEKGTWKIVDGYIVFDFQSAVIKHYSRQPNEVIRTEVLNSSIYSKKQFRLEGIYLRGDTTYEKIS